MRAEPRVAALVALRDVAPGFLGALCPLVTLLHPRGASCQKSALLGGGDAFPWVH